MRLCFNDARGGVGLLGKKKTLVRFGGVNTIERVAGHAQMKSASPVHVSQSLSIVLTPEKLPIVLCQSLLIIEINAHPALDPMGGGRDKPGAPTRQGRPTPELAKFHPV